jgi:hypothetical protein
MPIYSDAAPTDAKPLIAGQLNGHHAATRGWSHNHLQIEVQQMFKAAVTLTSLGKLEQASMRTAGNSETDEDKATVKTDA